MPGNIKQARIDEDDNEIRPKFLSNHTHYSPTDDDAKISVKPGKARLTLAVIITTDKQTTYGN